MATTGTGFDVPIALNLQRRQEKMEDEHNKKWEEHENQIQDLIGQRSALVSKISTIDDKNSPEYKQATDALKQVHTALIDIYHPQKNPGAIEKLGHLLTDHLKITSPEQREVKQKAQLATKDQNAQKATQLDVSAAPLSPAQASIADVNAKIAWIEKSNLSPEDKAEAKRKLFGVSEKPTLKLYSSPDGGTKAWLDASRPDTIPVGWTAYAATSADANKRADFEDFKRKYKKDTGKDYEGTLESWVAEQAATGRAKAPKPETLDNEYKAILVKEQSGQPLTPDEKAHKGAWQIWNKETKIDPGVARMAAAGANRYIMVYNQDDPENVVPMRAIDAARSGARSPQSISFKTDAAITRYMTSGAGGTNITYFNTATDHLRLLAQAGEALNNGNIQVFNEYANKFATATGDPAPSNFETVKAAVAGELSKTFKGTGATDAEISDINTTINQAQSPQQIQGAIQYYSSLMGSKVHALQLQYEAGKQGRPNFPASTPPPAAPKKHKIHIGQKYYTYNGTGDTTDLRNYTEVPK
jgi:hypothetical protein